MRQHSTIGRLLLAATIALPASIAPALSWQSPLGSLRKLPVAGRNVWMHPFNDDGGFGLYDHGVVSFDRAVAKSLYERMSNPFIEIRAENVTGLSLVSGSSSHDYRFFVAGVPLCGFQVRAHALASQKSGLVLGSIPEIDPASAAAAAHAEWADVNLAFENAAAGAIADAGESGAVMKRAERCFYVSTSGLMPVWRIELVAGGLPYMALADAYELVNLQRSFFDVDGTAKVFGQNILTGTQADYKLTGLAEDGSLKSEYLQVVVPDDREPAIEPTHKYNYKKDDPKFPQAQAYANVQRHFDYFKSLGFAWYGTAPLQVKLHVLPAGRKNNALFMPGGSDGSLPSISVHDGDGKELKNLATDADVVSHEFGHHVVYKTLRSTEGESLVLHEGLADFFAFSRTGDGCLGESICPAGNSVCVIETQCLRTAEIELAYQDDLWMRFAGPAYRLGHQHGMMISGMLWDMRKSGAVPGEDLAKLVFQAVQYFQPDSGFRDLMLSLMIADSELFGGKYNDAIRAAGDARGMSEFYEDVTPGAAIPQPEGGGSLLPEEDDDGNSKKKKEDDGGLFACGVVGGANNDTAQWALLALALVIPFLRVLKPAVARRRARRAPDRHR